MATYKETVYRFRVMKQLNDAERNPEGSWSLIYSTPDLGNAEEVAMEQREQWGDLGDKVKVVDNGEDTVIERQVY